MILIATYDLHQPMRDYPSVEKLLESASGGHSHAQESVWLLDTLKDPKWWRARLKEAGDEDDSFFVAQLTEAADWAGRKLDDGAGIWLNDSARRW
jgi:hypothetical protein